MQVASRVVAYEVAISKKIQMREGIWFFLFLEARVSKTPAPD
jgi:hypothetical protein